MAEVDLPSFNTSQFPADVLSKYGIVDVGELTPPNGLIKLGGLLMVNEKCRDIFEGQVGMSVAQWFSLANKAFGFE